MSNQESENPLVHIANEIVMISAVYEEILRLLDDLASSVRSNEFDEKLEEIQVKAIIIEKAAGQALDESNRYKKSNPEVWEFGRKATPLLAGISLTSINIVNIRDPDQLRELLGSDNMISRQQLLHLLRASGVEDVLG